MKTKIASIALILSLSLSSAGASSVSECLSGLLEDQIGAVGDYVDLKDKICSSLETSDIPSNGYVQQFGNTLFAVTGNQKLANAKTAKEICEGSVSSFGNTLMEVTESDKVYQAMQELGTFEVAVTARFNECDENGLPTVVEVDVIKPHNFDFQGKMYELMKRLGTTADKIADIFKNVTKSNKEICEERLKQAKKSGKYDTLETHDYYYNAKDELMDKVKNNVMNNEYDSEEEYLEKIAQEYDSNDEYKKSLDAPIQTLLQDYGKRTSISEASIFTEKTVVQPTKEAFKGTPARYKYKRFFDFQRKESMDALLNGFKGVAFDASKESKRLEAKEIEIEARLIPKKTFLKKAKDDVEEIAAVTIDY